MARISSAMERIEAARHQAEVDAAMPENGKPGSSQVISLINAHEKLREEVADTIGQIDALIGDLEDE